VSRDFIKDVKGTITALLAQVCLLAAPAATATPATAEADIREAGRLWLMDSGGIGLTIAIYADGQRRYYNFGTTLLDGSRLPTADTVYEIGSLSKTFAGQLLARAVVEGRATLEDEVARYLDGTYPNLQNGGEKVRLRHLVSSTSQLMDNIPDLTQVRAVRGEPLPVTHLRVFEAYSREDFLRQLRRVMPRRPPGEAPAYSNVGAMLLGVALEKIFGEPFEQILAREIEKPMRMASGTAPSARLLARGYTAANEPLPPFTARTQFASLSLRYSAKDLLTYAAWQMLERDASTKLAHRATWSTPDGRQGVGFFWILGDSPQGRRLWQGGTTFGFSSLCEIYPDEKIAVVLLSNKAADDAQVSLRALSAKIVRLLRPESPEGAAVRLPLSSADAPPPAH
jgi:D-alanyl-D-alanine-carboxypeptidase/D-alanyl-D-alanine-endopeptidase